MAQISLGYKKQATGFFKFKKPKNRETGKPGAQATTRVYNSKENPSYLSSLPKVLVAPHWILCYMKGSVYR